MAKEPSKNGTPKSNDPAIKKHFKILVGIAAAWLLLFVLMLIEKEAEVRAVLPIVGLVFIIYLVYATVSVLTKRL